MVSCKAYFFIIDNCHFVLSFVALKIPVVNVIPNKEVVLPWSYANQERIMYMPTVMLRKILRGSALPD